MNTQITLLICTYNRSDILQDCLQSLVQQTMPSSAYKVLIINNNSTDNTQEIIDQFTQKYPNFTSLIEPQQGLSHARNSGYQAATTEWLAYIDDDAKAHPNYVERAFWVIEHYDFDCFGGMYYPWYKFGKPAWLPDDFGRKELLRDSIGVLEKNGLSGGNMVMKKSILEQIGGFRTDLGMNGVNMGYGEDDAIVLKHRTLGYTVGFDPELKIDHAVMPHKFSLFWHIKQSFISGRDYQRLMNSTFIYTFIYLIRSVGSLFFKRLPQAIFYLIKQKKYFWQNAFLHLFQPIFFGIGLNIGWIRRKLSSKMYSS